MVPRETVRSEMVLREMVVEVVVHPVRQEIVPEMMEPVEVMVAVPEEDSAEAEAERRTP